MCTYYEEVISVVSEYRNFQYLALGCVFDLYPSNSLIIDARAWGPSPFPKVCEFVGGTRTLVSRCSLTPTVHKWSLHACFHSLKTRFKTIIQKLNYILAILMNESANLDFFIHNAMIYLFHFKHHI